MWKDSFSDFDVESLANEDIRIKILDKPITKMRFKWNEKETEKYDAPAFCHPDKKKIVVTYPLPENYDLTPNQVLSHEIGHWHFDRLYDDKVAADEKIGYRSDIDWYKYYSEMAAIFTEKKVSGKLRKKELPLWVSDKLLPELAEIEKKYSNVLEEITKRFDSKWDELKEKNKFPYDF